MNITITGSNGEEEVIAQLIEDLLHVNGIQTNRNAIDERPKLSIEQLEHRLYDFKKDKLTFNIVLDKNKEINHQKKTVKSKSRYSTPAYVNDYINMQFAVVPAEPVHQAVLLNVPHGEE